MGSLLGKVSQFSGKEWSELLDYLLWAAPATAYSRDRKSWTFESGGLL